MRLRRAGGAVDFVSRTSTRRRRVREDRSELTGAESTARLPGEGRAPRHGEVTEGRALASGALPIHWTEWNASWRVGRPIHDVTNLAAYLAERSLTFTARSTARVLDDIGHLQRVPFPRESFVGDLA